MRRYLRKKRNTLESNVLAHVLPFVAGTVNATGFYIVGTYTSHVTGSVARVGDDLAQGNKAGALRAMLLVASFFFGALLAAALAERAHKTGRSPYSGTLEMEALALGVIAALGVTEPKGIHWLNTLTTALLCVAMGMQNALVTNLSGAVVRTTHLTGIVTDMGIEAVRATEWLLHTRRAPKASGVVRTLFRYRTFPELKMLRLHAAIFASFLTGAIVGPFLYVRYGFALMALPIAILVAMVVFDRFVGFRGQARVPSEHTPDDPQPPVPE